MSRIGRGHPAKAYIRQTTGVPTPVPPGGTLAASMDFASVSATGAAKASGTITASAGEAFVSTKKPIHGDRIVPVHYEDRTLHVPAELFVGV